MQGQDFDPFEQQRGQAIFLVLVAIILFAALAYVVTQATPENPALQPPAIKTMEQLVGFPAEVQIAVRKLMDNNIKQSDLDFHQGANGKNAVFALTAYRRPGFMTGGKNDWAFKEIKADGSGYFVAGIGTDDAKGKDLLIYLEGFTEDTCSQINEALNIPKAILKEDPPVDLSGNGGGPKDKAGKNAFTFKAHQAHPKTAACVQNGRKYVYYHVIVAN